MYWLKANKIWIHEFCLLLVTWRTSVCIQTDKSMQNRLIFTSLLPLPQYSWAFFWLWLGAWPLCTCPELSHFSSLSFWTWESVFFCPVDHQALFLGVIMSQWLDVMSSLFHEGNSIAPSPCPGENETSFLLLLLVRGTAYSQLVTDSLRDVPAAPLLLRPKGMWTPRGSRHVRLCSGNLTCCFCFVSILTEKWITNSNN